MIINDIPLQSLKDILASDTPLAIETTEALIARLESSGMRLDAVRRQRDAYQAQARKAEQALTRVSTMFEGVTIDHGNGVIENVNDSIRATITRALDGDQS